LSEVSFRNPQEFSGERRLGSTRRSAGFTASIASRAAGGEF